MAPRRAKPEHTRYEMCAHGAFRTLFTSFEAYICMFDIQFLTDLKVSLSVTSYTKRMPIAPR